MMMINHTFDNSHSPPADSAASVPPSTVSAQPAAAANQRQSLFRSGAQILAWLTVGTLLGFVVLAAISPLSASEQLRVFGALAAGFGLVHLWLAIDQSNVLAMVGSAVAGSTILLLALNALPGHPAMLVAAYLLGALASFAASEKASPLLLSTGAGLLVLALLGP